MSSTDLTGIIGYNIYQSTNPDLPKKEWKKLNHKPLPETRFRQDKSQLAPGTTYYSYVTSVNALGIESEPSEVVSLTVPADTGEASTSEEETPVASDPRLPRRITPVPVKEAVTEIRFDSGYPADAIFGVVYNEFKSGFPTTERLPILQMPEIVRTSDPNLLFQPYYRLRKGNFLLSVGPKVLSLSVTEPYPGWDIYLPEILNIFSRLPGLGIIDRVTRAAIRYTDFFQGDIFEGISLSIRMNNELAPTREAYFRTVIPKGKLLCLLQIGNNTKIQSPGLVQMGSIIDVDTYSDEDLEHFFEKAEIFLNEAHLAQKHLFFSLLKPEFLAKFNPEY